MVNLSLCPSKPWYPYMQEAVVLQPPVGWLSKMAIDFIAQLQQRESSAGFLATVLKGHFCPNQIFQFCIVDLKLQHHVLMSYLSGYLLVQ